MTVANPQAAGTPNKEPQGGGLDKIDANAFVRFFNSITAGDQGEREGEGKGEGGTSSPAVIRFFDRKAYISVHGYNEEPYIVSRILYKSVAQVVHLNGGGRVLPSITLTHNLFPIILKELLAPSNTDAVKYRVEYWQEGEGQSRFGLVSASSPGRLDSFMEEQICAGANAFLDEHPVVAAVTVRYDATHANRTVGLAYIDIFSHTLGACEFVDDAQFCTLETCLTQLGPKEVVVCEDVMVGAEPSGQVTSGGRMSKDGRTLMNLFANCNGILVSKRPKGAFKVSSLEQDVGRLLVDGKGGVEREREVVVDLKEAAGALAGVIGFADVLGDASHHGRYTLEQFSTGKYMRLDSAAQKALNVLKSKTDANDSFSLYGLMDRCATPMGKRLLKTWLKQPLTSKADIERRLDVVEVLVADGSARADLKEVHLRGVPDVHRLGRRLDTRAATLKELCDLHRICTRLPGIIRVLNDCVKGENDKGDMGMVRSQLIRDAYIVPLEQAGDGEHLGKFQDLVEAAVDFERIPEEYLINSQYDAELGEIQGKREEVEREIERHAEQAASDLGLELGKTIKLEWHKVSNQKIRCLRITKKEEMAARSAMKSMRFIELETRKDGVKFTNDRLRGAAERLQQLSLEYDRKQAKLIAQVVEVAATFSPVWEKVAEVLAELDVLNGFAVLSSSAPIPYVRPVLVDTMDGVNGMGGNGSDDAQQRIVLKGSRHPCVEAQDSVSFIPNDVSMNKGESWFQIITGPNMGGKSTFIRQIGMCVLMAQVGCFVPCDEATIAIRDAIFARVGAGDCQLRGVSTFMAEMLETASILKGATDKSLVIIDELGRGTSTWDGMGLAWAISEHLMEKIGAATLFATHFHELTALQGSVGVKNLHVKSTIDAARGGLTMLYQVHEGSCDQSLGIHVAEFARFPPKIIDDAKAKALELDGTMVVDIVEATKKDGEPDDEAARKRTRGAPATEEDIKRVLLEFARVDFEQGASNGQANPMLVQEWKTKLETVVGTDALARKKSTL